MCSNVQDAIGIDVECHLNLRDAPWGRRDSIKMELTQQVVVLSHRAFTFEHLDENSRLVVRVGGEGLALLCWNRGVALDQLRHHTTCRLKTHGQRSDIQEQ